VLIVGYSCRTHQPALELVEDGGAPRDAGVVALVFDLHAVVVLLEYAVSQRLLRIRIHRLASAPREKEG
jgi:hypothetical protein